MTVSARPRNGLTVQGGFSGGYSTSDNCEVRDKVPEIALLNPYCHIETSFLPQYKGIATYIMPKIDVSVSGTFTSKPGIQVSGFGTPVAGGAFAANYTVVERRRRRRSSAGRLSGSAAQHHRQPDRAALDPRRARQRAEHAAGQDRPLRRGAALNVGVDFYNLLNAATPLSYNQAFIPDGAWLTPTSVLSARFAKIRCRSIC